MTREQESELFAMVLEATDLRTGQVDSVIELMKIKNHIDHGCQRAALVGLLEFVLRTADLGPVRTTDDLTKLLNTGVSGKFDSARILINGIDENEV